MPLESTIINGSGDFGGDSTYHHQVLGKTTIVLAAAVFLACGAALFQAFACTASASGKIP
jgi:hypothetical protein